MAKSRLLRVSPIRWPLIYFPHNTPINQQGYCEEEMKMINETRKNFLAYPILRIFSDLYSGTCTAGAFGSGKS